MPRFGQFPLLCLPCGLGQRRTVERGRFYELGTTYAALFTSPLYNRNAVGNHLRRDAMDDQKTAADVERLLHALKAERNARKDAERDRAQLRAELERRIAALEARPVPDIAVAVAGIAEIRRDVVAMVATMQAEIDDLSTSLAELLRRP